MMLENLLSLLYFLVIGANILLALVILYRGLTNKINILFCVTILVLSFWVLASFLTNYYAYLGQIELASFWFRMRYLTIFPVPALFLYISIIFPENLNIGHKGYVLFIPTAFLYLFQFNGKIALQVNYDITQNFVRQVYGEYIYLFAIYYLLYFALTFLTMGIKYFALKGVHRIQIKYVFIGTFFPVVVGGLGNFFLPLFGINPGFLFNIAPLSTVFIAAMLSIAIIKHKVMGFNYVFGKSIIYTFVVAFITVSYFALLFILTKYIMGISGASSIVLNVIFFVIFAIIFGPIKEKIQSIINLFLFKSKYDYEKTLKQISLAITFIDNREKFFEFVAKLLKKRMGLDSFVLFFYEDKENAFIAKGVAGSAKPFIGEKLPLDNPIVQYLEETKKEFFISDIENLSSDFFIFERDRQKFLSLISEMDKFKAILFFPIMLNNTLIAFLALGSKISGDIFDDEDMNFLRSLSAQISIFIQNLLLIEKEKARAEQIAFSQAREKYVMMLERKNKELEKAKDELLKEERKTTITVLSLSLQREIVKPIEKIIDAIDDLDSRTERNETLSKEDLREIILNIELQAKKVRALLHNLNSLVMPLVKE